MASFIIPKDSHEYPGQMGIIVFGLIMRMRRVSVRVIGVINLLTKST